MKKQTISSLFVALARLCAHTAIQVKLVCMESFLSLVERFRKWLNFIVHTDYIDASLNTIHCLYAKRFADG